MRKSYKQNTVTQISPGERARNTNPGGGGYGNSFERDIAAVLKDVRERIISIEAAKLEYGVVVDPKTLQVDEKQTAALREQQKQQKKIA